MAAGQHLVALHAEVPQTHFLAQQASLHLLQGFLQHLEAGPHLQALVPQTHFLAQQASLHPVQGLATALQHLEAGPHLQAEVPQTHFLAQQASLHAEQGLLAATFMTLLGAALLAIVLAIV